MLTIGIRTFDVLRGTVCESGSAKRYYHGFQEYSRWQLKWLPKLTAILHLNFMISVDVFMGN